jgi:hypothetical protein
MTGDPRMDTMDRTGRMGGMSGGQGMAGGMSGGMGGQGMGMGGQGMGGQGMGGQGMGGQGMGGQGMAGGMAGGMSGGMAGGPAGTGPMDHHRTTSMPMGPGQAGMGPVGSGAMHGRSRSASRGMPGNRGPGYHSLDRDGYGERDFMPIREPRERSLDRDFGYGGGGGGYGGAGTVAGGYGAAGASAAYGRRERSLDRRDMLDPEDGFYTGRDPMMRGGAGDPMGVRSQRLSPNPNLVGGGMGQTSVSHPTRDNYFADLQTCNSDLQRDLANLRKELELTNQKLGSSMHSIKTFWSPELKKERALRKEESAKYSLINDQLKLLNSENQVSTNITAYTELVVGVGRTLLCVISILAMHL